MASALYSEREINAIIAAAVKAEREACAKIADERAAICLEAQSLGPETLPHVERHTHLEAVHIASLIRMRQS